MWTRAFMCGSPGRCLGSSSTPTSPRSLRSPPLPPQARAERRILSRSRPPCGSLQRLRPLHVCGAALRENPEPARHLLVAFLDAAQILAEAVLVELLVGLEEIGRAHV